MVVFGSIYSKLEVVPTSGRISSAVEDRTPHTLSTQAPRTIQLMVSGSGREQIGIQNWLQPREVASNAVSDS